MQLRKRGPEPVEHVDRDGLSRGAARERDREAWTGQHRAVGDEVRDPVGERSMEQPCKQARERPWHQDSA